MILFVFYSFRWGSSPICKSSANLINLDSNAEDSIFEKTRIRNISKIDPRIVADVQSKGLASRIVKYHENESRLNRSMSAHNLYSKPGQFPLVTLKKTELPYRATKQNVSMTRIAPPGKQNIFVKAMGPTIFQSQINLFFVATACPVCCDQILSWDCIEAMMIYRVKTNQLFILRQQKMIWLLREVFWMFLKRFLVNELIAT